jgi:hypothetical protein
VVMYWQLDMTFTVIIFACFFLSLFLSPAVVLILWTSKGSIKVFHKSLSTSLPLDIIRSSSYSPSKNTFYICQ